MYVNILILVPTYVLLDSPYVHVVYTPILLYKNYLCMPTQMM